MISGAGHGQGISGKLLHFQAPFWSDIASAFPLVVLVSRLAALWRLRVRGECRRGPGGLLCGDADQPRLGISDTTCCMGTYAAAAGFPFRPDQKDTTTRQSSSPWLPGTRHGKKTKRRSPEQTPDPRFFFFILLFWRFLAVRARVSCVTEGPGLPRGQVFCTPGSLARRRLVRVIHHHHKTPPPKFSSWPSEVNQNHTRGSKIRARPRAGRY